MGSKQSLIEEEMGTILCIHLSAFQGGLQEEYGHRVEFKSSSITGFSQNSIWVVHGKNIEIKY